MKKLTIAILAVMLMCPVFMDAKQYKVFHAEDLPNLPRRAPAANQIGVYMESEYANLYVSPNYDITGLEITITGNGVTYLDTTVSLNAGQVYLDCLDYLDEGEYTLTLSTANGVIDQYTITVEPD